MSRTAIVVALAAASAAAVALCAAEPPPPPQPTPQDLVGKVPPEITAKYWINSDPLKREALRGKVVLVDFWGTWCIPCREAIPHLVALHKKYAAQGLVIIGSTLEAKEKVEPFVKQMGINYAIGGGSDVFTKYNVSAIPVVFIVGKDGKVVMAADAETKFDKIESVVAAELKKSPPSDKAGDKSGDKSGEKGKQ